MSIKLNSINNLVNLIMTTAILSMNIDTQHRSTLAKTSLQTSKTSLIVNYLPPQMTEEEIDSLFSRIGEVESVKLVRDKKILIPDPFHPGIMKGQSLAYGFVNYCKAEHAEQAVNILNGLLIQNKTIKVSYARPSCDAIKGANVYISGLPKGMTLNQLEDIFRPYGEIITSRILSNQSIYPQSKGIGFIRFDTRDEASQAIEAINGTIPNGFTEPISAKFSNTPGNTLKMSQCSSTVQLNSPLDEQNLYISGLPKSMSQMELENLFKPYGEILTSRIVHNLSGKDRGIGFIRYENREQATRAIAAMNGVIPLYCADPILVKYSKVGTKRQPPDISSLLMKSSVPKRNKSTMHTPINKGLARYSPIAVDIPDIIHSSNINTGLWNIFVYNLGPECEENALWQLFGPFGAVQNVKIIRDNETNLCKGYGFVTMLSYEDAIVAIHELNGCSLGGRILQVSFKTKKQHNPIRFQINAEYKRLKKIM